ncbi:MAG: homoserine kinase [Gemmatimonadales bacterium]
MSAPVERASALAPATVGNVGPGLDVLGMALTGPGDRVTAERTETPGVTIADAGHPELPTEAQYNTAGIAARSVLERAASKVGVRLTIEKGLPLAGGQGGSAASAVASAVAVNRLLGNPLDANALLECALDAEGAVSGRHADNIAPALLGGIVLVLSTDPMDVVPLPVPAALRVVLAHPDQRLSTAESRDALPSYLARSAAIMQMARCAGVVAALANGDLALLGRAVVDQIAEPARSQLLPGFMMAKMAALQAGALGGSISGAGPSSFYFTDSDAAAEKVAAAVRDSYGAKDIKCSVRIERVAPLGALALPQDAAHA